MTIKFTPILTWAAGLLLAGAAPAAAQAPAAAGVAILTGHISSPQQDTIAVTIKDSPFDPKERITYARVDEKGEFRLSVPVTTSTRADLVYGDDVADLYLDPGTDLDVRFKGNDMSSTVKFKPNDMPTGFATKLRNGGNLTDEQRHRQQMANANNYLSEFDAQFVSNDGFQVLPDNIQLYEAPFISFIEYRLKHEKNFLEDRAAKQSFTIDFYNYAKAEVAYSNLNDRLTFQDLREQVVSTESRLAMTPTYYDFLRDPLLYTDPTAAQNEQFQEFLLNYIHHTAAQQKHLRSDPDFYPFCYALASKRFSGVPKLITLGRILQESFRFGHIRQSEAMLADYRNLDTKHRFLATLEGDFSSHRTLAIGAPAPDFRLVTSTGDTASLHSYQGKLVYLNFWKTTNGLCLRDLAYAQDLAKRFEGKNIVFVNVALDDAELPWSQLVKVKKLPGVHMRLAGGYQSATAQAYSLQEVPTYLLIGEDGTILNPKPKRMSSRAAVDEINQSFGKASTYSAAITQLSPSAGGK